MAIVGFCQTVVDEILNLYLRNTVATIGQTTPYLALFTTDPLETGASGEVSGGTYGRQAVTFGAPGAGTGTGRRVTASGSPVASFTGMPACTVTHWGIWDANATGNFICGGALGASQALLPGDTYNVTSLTFDLD